MKFRSALFAGVLGAAVLAGSAANASVIASGAFPTFEDPYFSATDGSGTIPAGGQTAYMWTTGDYVATLDAEVSGSYLATSFTDTFMIQNGLGDGNNLTVEGVLNGVDIGSFTADDSDYSGDDQNINFNVSFAPILISGPFTFEYVLENTIPPGGGAIAFLDGGEATIFGTSTSVPEPSPLSLVLAGLAAIAGAFYFGRKKVLAS